MRGGYGSHHVCVCVCVSVCLSVCPRASCYMPRFIGDQDPGVIYQALLLIR